MSRSTILIVLFITLILTALTQAQFYQEAVLGHKTQPQINANDVASPSTQEVVMEDAPVLQATSEETETTEVQSSVNIESIGGIIGGIIGGGGSDRREKLKSWLNKLGGSSQEEQLATVLDVTSEVEALLSQLEN